MRVAPRQWLANLRSDLRHAVRGVHTSPGFAAAVILTLGLGIGANAAMFGVVDRLMFRPHPYLRDPSTVHRVYLNYLYRGEAFTAWHTEFTRYLDLKEWTSSLSQYAAFANWQRAVGTGDASRERPVSLVTASFFDFFDARPALGRFFTPAEDVTPRGADVVVLGYDFWQVGFGGRDVLGEVLQVDNVSATIIGVAPEGFVGVSDNRPPDVYLPITTFAGSRGPRTAETYYTRYNWGWVQVMVRRKPDVTLDRASADLSQAYVQSWTKEIELDPPGTPVSIAKPTAVAAAMKTDAGPEPSLEGRTAFWVTGVAVIVLLVACANVANLFLARALKRQREIAVRLALGVSRGRLFAQSVTESVLLSLMGIGVGLLVAEWGGRGIRRLLINTQGASLEVFTDWRTLGVATAVALAAGVLTGAAPAVLAGRGDLARSLKAGSREGMYQRSRTRTALLVAQGALCVTLLVGAGLFVKSLENVKSMRMGYDAESVLFVTRNLRGMQLDDSTLVQLRRSLHETARAIPGVEAATFVSTVPFWSTSSTSLFVAGIDSVRALGRFTYQSSTADYFDVMGTRVLRGRGFTKEDRPESPRVAVVSEGMAGALWPGKDAIGQCMRVGSDTMPCTTVVGIAEDMIQRNITDPGRFQYYMLLDQYRATGGFGLMIRVRGKPEPYIKPVRQALQAVMPGQSYVTVTPFLDIVDSQRRSWRLGATMFVAFGALALVVAAVGLFSVIGYTVTQRMHDLGVRVALGARSADILRLVVGQGVRFAVAGAALGTLLALGLSRWVQPLLFQQSARDPIVYGAVALLLVFVALAASASPGIRAANADPNVALRAE